jgi:hypothetical protein
MIGYLASKNNTTLPEIKKSVIYGNVMGSFAVEKYGLTGLTSTTKAKIQTRIKKYQSMIDF